MSKEFDNINYLFSIIHSEVTGSMEAWQDGKTNLSTGKINEAILLLLEVRDCIETY